VLTEAPKFEYVVISATGKMALMKTVAPATFVAFKRWMAESAPQRPQPKRRRDLRQAAIVQALLDEGLLVP
jgi:Nucleotidyltransferase